MVEELETLPPLIDGELVLHLVDRTLVQPSREPADRFEMRVRGEKVGSATLRIAGGDYYERYAGQIGYGVELPYRGRHYAARSCRLLFEVARRHGLSQLWITCNPENVASRRTCELVGGELVEIVDVPPTLDLYREGDRQKCRYRIRL
jgi:tagatose 1,6-diphosphate aldolase